MSRKTLILLVGLVLSALSVAKAEDVFRELIATNRVDAGAATNMIFLVEGTNTNLTLQFRFPDGTFTNVRSRAIIVIAPPLKFDEPKVVPVRAPVGDFWLPGEFQRLLEEKKWQRRQRGE